MEAIDEKVGNSHLIDQLAIQETTLVIDEYPGREDEH
jgi:hypothetical protein